MSESNRGRIRDTTVPVLLGTLLVALFYTTASTHRRLADMEERLLDQLDQVDQQLMDTIQRQENAGVDQ